MLSAEHLEQLPNFWKVLLGIQADKNEYHEILAGLQGLTGENAVDSEAMTVKVGYCILFAVIGKHGAKRES